MSSVRPYTQLTDTALVCGPPRSFRSTPGASVRRFAAYPSTSTRASRRGIVISAAEALSATTLAALGLATVGAVAASASMLGEPSKDPRRLTQTGMAKFRANKVEESVEDFDRVIAVAPKMRPYMWQRGLSLYYLARYEEGAQQFRDDVAVNPNDTEESIWAFLCEAQLLGPGRARQQFLQVGRDPRPVMRAAYECFQSGAQPGKILAAAADDGGHDTFYALLYVGLWHEAHGEEQQARDAILKAVDTQYAQLSGDYMASLATVHALRRGWMQAAAGAA